MTIRNLDKAFAPRSVALIGASPKPGSIGAVMMRNLFAGGFSGDIWLVNPKYSQIDGHPCYSTVESLPAPPDLAVIATPPRTIPDLVARLGEKGTRAAVIITAGIREGNLQQAMLDAAKPYCLRIVGPNCLGMIVTGTGLNASFSHVMPKKGDLAFISQSGALIGAMLDWAAARDAGFSCMVSMGDMADVDVGDLLDYLAADAATSAILMYLEQVTNARKFMSAARAAARVKPVIVIKSGRNAESAKAAKSHTGALAGADYVYEAAFRRAGIVRVEELEDLFDTAEMLRNNRLCCGDQLAIVTNGGGAGVLAVDRLLGCGGKLAALSPETMEKLNAVLPSTWSKGNPVDIIGDADALRHEAAMEIVLADPAVHAVLVMNCPTALASSDAAADAVIAAAHKRRAAGGLRKTVLAAWLGDRASHAAQEKFERAGISSYSTPEEAVRGFTYLAQHYQAQEALLRTPPSLPDHLKADRERARHTIAEALEKGREHLNEREAKLVLSAYGIPVVPSHIVRRWDEVAQAAEGFLTAGHREVVVKILSPDILHKSDAGGVALGLPSAQAAMRAAEEMFLRIKKAYPKAIIDGFTIQPMIRRGHARELILGMTEDATFGPVVLFGAGGTAVEVIRDRAVALPPLDMHLARDLISQTQVFRMLQAYRNEPAADIDAIATTLLRLSQMITELPEIRELDINPLLADEKGVMALDARIIARKADAGADGLNPRLVIRPYPQQWEKNASLRDGQSIFIRPIRPEDEHLYKTFLAKTSPEDLRRRLFSAQQNLTHDFIARLTQIDYGRAMAFVALDPASGELLGVSRLCADPDYARAEFAAIVRSDQQGRGIGFALMQRLVEYAEAEGIGELWAYTMLENAPMLRMCRELGFKVAKADDDPCVVMARISLPRRQEDISADMKIAAS